MSDTPAPVTFDHLFENIPEPPVDQQVATALRVFLRQQAMIDRYYARQQAAIERAAEKNLGRGLRVTVRPDGITVKSPFVNMGASTPDILGDLAAEIFLAARDLNPEWRYRGMAEMVN